MNLKNVAEKIKYAKTLKEKQKYQDMLIEAVKMGLITENERQSGLYGKPGKIKK